MQRPTGLHNNFEAKILTSVMSRHVLPEAACQVGVNSHRLLGTTERHCPHAMPAPHSQWDRIMQLACNSLGLFSQASGLATGACRVCMQSLKQAASAVLHSKDPTFSPHHHHHQITKLSHSINAIGPAPHF
jgi:hypothetical protein